VDACRDLAWDDAESVLRALLGRHEGGGACGLCNLSRCLANARRMNDSREFIEALAWAGYFGETIAIQCAASHALENLGSRPHMGSGGFSRRELEEAQRANRAVKTAAEAPQSVA
jgi:hypothetical protein